MTKTKFYAIKPSTIVTTWAECETLVKGVSGVNFKSFKSRELAQAWLDDDTNTSTSDTTSSPSILEPPTPVPYITTKTSGFITVADENFDPLTLFARSTRVSVDGSFNSDTQTYGSGVVFFDKNGTINTQYRMSGSKPELAQARNVAGEVNAFALAIANAVKQNLTSLTIICDYEGLFRWTANPDTTINNQACWGNKQKTPIAQLHAKAIDYAANHGLHELDFIWVRGHKGFVCNELADQLAGQAADVH